MRRTSYCGLVRESHIGQKVTACGWVQTKRDMGGVVFIDLRDREGVLQVVFNVADFADSQEFAIAEGLRNESVILVEGTVRLRDAETVNPKIATGTVELAASHIELLSQATTLPYDLSEGVNVREDLRLKYRYLDIRRPEMLDNLKFRHKLQKVSEDYLDGAGFIQVETPMLTKSTPEGARDYLVPSRVHPGNWYALPQSPQLFKQLLMVGGVDKYYQVARCFRDEDLRADRQPEFTQVDMEMSFIEQEDVLRHLEGLFKDVSGKMLPDNKSIQELIQKPFPRFTWQEAMDRFGSDKPDIRFGLEIIDLTDIARTCSFAVFRKVTDKGGIVRAINVKGGNSFTRTTIENLTTKAQSYGAGGMAWIAIRDDGERYSILSKYFKESEMDAIVERVDAKPGDFILFCADKPKTVYRTLGGLRQDIADLLGLRKKDEFAYCIITDFPLFEYSEEENRFVAQHHPFTMPYEEDLPYMLSDPGRVRAQAYDFVLNGVELGSGSIRIHRPDVQELMFKALGFSDEEAQSRFGFLINAFRYGTPPHGGFAFGLDRLVMLMVGADSLRDVIAFPKVKDASCLMTDAPNIVDQEQLEVLKLCTGTTEAGQGAASGAAGKKAPAKVSAARVAKLAMLEFTKEQEKAIEKDLDGMIAFADRLSELNADGVAATAHIADLRNVMREDNVVTPFDRDLMLKNAPTSGDGFVTVSVKGEV